MLRPSFSLNEYQKYSFIQCKSNMVFAFWLIYLTFVRSSLGPVVAAFCNRFGCRRVAIAGGITAFLGFFLCSFSPNLDVMIFLYGFVGGKKRKHCTAYKISLKNVLNYM